MSAVEDMMRENFRNWVNGNRKAVVESLTDPAYNAAASAALTAAFCHLLVEMKKGYAVSTLCEMLIEEANRRSDEEEARVDKLNCWFPCAEVEGGGGATLTHHDDNSLTVTVREKGSPPILATARIGPKAVALITDAIAHGWDGTEPNQEQVAPIVDDV